MSDNHEGDDVLSAMAERGKNARRARKRPGLDVLVGRKVRMKMNPRVRGRVAMIERRIVREAWVEGAGKKKVTKTQKARRPYMVIELEDGRVKRVHPEGFVLRWEVEEAG